MPQRSPILNSLTTLAVLATGLAALIAPPPAQAGDCTVVEVRNVRPSQGAVLLAIYDDPASFQRKPVAAQRQLAGPQEVVQFSVCDLRGRTVAMSLMQDLNANGRMDFGALGRPAEPWGSSGTLPLMSAPTWESSQVVLGEQPVVIRLTP
jgi:uncharacterized protein (DUF2141 family)